MKIEYFSFLLKKPAVRALWVVISAYTAVILALFLYSFTQVDLSLTLSRSSIWQSIQQSFQYIGYFDRPFSTHLYITLLFLLFGFYLYFLWRAVKKKLSEDVVWLLIIVISGILLFSYTAFSYDLFNYIFDAKIITHYGLNPYTHKALDFPGDPMLSFMHWTHRTYPYGPIWLLLTVPLSFLGMQFFLPTFFLFKLLIVGGFMGTVYYIGKILRRVAPGQEVYGIVVFAFNPLVIIESLVSAHNDIVMVFFAVLGVYLLIEKKYAYAFLALVVSYGIKFATAALPMSFHVGVIAGLAAFFYLLRRKKTFHIRWQDVFVVLATVMVLPVLLASYRTTFQPWYLLFVLPFAALVGDKYNVIVPVVVFSVVGLLQYVPYLYLGNWDPPVPSILMTQLYYGVLVSVVLVGGWFVKTTFFSKK